MDRRKIACIIATGIGAGLLGTATAPAFAQPPSRSVTVTGQRIEPATQRLVHYSDLNLAVRRDQRVLKRRIFKTANSLCLDMMNVRWPSDCGLEAIRSTDDQVSAAIQRAEMKMAGKSVGPAVAISMVIGGR